MDNIEIEELDDLKCGHFFHRECVGEYIELKINEKNFPILCPSLECKKEIPPEDFKE